MKVELSKTELLLLHNALTIMGATETYTEMVSPLTNKIGRLLIAETLQDQRFQRQLRDSEGST